MASWRELSNECRQAAWVLHERGHYRSALNRAYYAVFSEVTRALHIAGVKMPMGWEGPSHLKVVNGTLISDHLGKWLRPQEIGKLIHYAATLYKYRRVADYEPSSEVTAEHAKTGLGLMLMAAPLLEKVQ